MTFEEAEIRFRELQARVLGSEPIGRATFEEQVSQLAVQDERGIWWEIHPHAGRWMYFDGMQWSEAIPPGRESSAVTPFALAAGRESPSAPSQPTAAGATRAFPSSPRVSSERTSPVSPQQDPGRDLLPRTRLQRTPRDHTREWIPFAIGAVILFACAVILFFGGPLALRVLGPEPTAMRTPLIAKATVTPIPSITPIPTLPIPTATSVPVVAKIIERRVNVRAAPSTKAAIIGKVLKDDIITLIGRNEDGTWYQVIIAGRAEPAWIFAETMEITSGDPKTLPLVQ